MSFCLIKKELLGVLIALSPTALARPENLAWNLIPEVF